MSLRTLACACMLALLAGGCTASIGGKKPRTSPEGASSAPSSSTATGRGDSGSEGAQDGSMPRAPGTVTAPWDTAARSREARRQHVYPKGESEIGKRLVDSLPDPGWTDASPGAAGSVSGSTTTGHASGTGTLPPVTGECWEVQLLVTTDKGRAEHVRDEAEKRLNTSVWVKSEGVIHKVRAGGCLTADGAARFAESVRQKGYPEAFRVPRER